MGLGLAGIGLRRKKYRFYVNAQPLTERVGSNSASLFSNAKHTLASLPTECYEGSRRAHASRPQSQIVRFPQRTEKWTPKLGQCRK